MTIFAVFAAAQPEKLSGAIAKHFPGNFTKVSDDSWFISADGTSKDVSDKLGVTDGASGGAIVVSVSGYYGRASTPIWEWVKAKWEGSSLG